MTTRSRSGSAARWATGPTAEVRYARSGALATNIRLVLTPEDLVRPPYDVSVEGADAFVELVQPRAT